MGAGADVDADDDIVIFHHAPQRIPVVAMHRWQTLGDRIIEETDSTTPLGGHPFGFGYTGIDIPQRYRLFGDHRACQTAANTLQRCPG